MIASKLTPAMIYNDRTCPKCCCKMMLVETYERGIKIGSFYECSNCGFRAPIYHEEPKDNKTIPLSENKLKDFIKSFGK